MRRRTVLLSAPVVLLGAACSDSKAKPDADPAKLIEQARSKFAEAKSVGFSLDSKDVPKDANGVSGAQGSGVVDANEPKFSGTVQGRVKGVSGTIELIAIGAEVWMKFFTPDYQPIDPATLNAPNPAMFFHPTQGLPSLLSATTALKAGEQKRSGKDVLTKVTGKLPAKPVYDLLKLGNGQGEYDVTYGITDGGELRTIDVVGAFYEGATSTYSVVVKDYGKPVDIKHP